MTIATKPNNEKRIYVKFNFLRMKLMNKEKEEFDLLFIDRKQQRDF